MLHCGIDRSVTNYETKTCSSVHEQARCGLVLTPSNFDTYLNSQQSQYYLSPLNFTLKVSFFLLHHLLHFHAAHPYAPLPAVGITPDHGTAPSVTGLSQFILGIISYQLLTFPLGLALSSSAPEQRSTARHN